MLPCMKGIDMSSYVFVFQGLPPPSLWPCLWGSMSAWPVGSTTAPLLAVWLSGSFQPRCSVLLSTGCVCFTYPWAVCPESSLVWRSLIKTTASQTTAKQACCQRNLSTLHTNREGTALSHTLCWHAITVLTHLQHERHTSHCTISLICQFSKQELITLLKSQPRRGMGRSILKYQHP